MVISFFLMTNAYLSSNHQLKTVLKKESVNIYQYNALYSCTLDKDNLRFYPGIEDLIIPKLSYPGHQETSLCEIAS